MPSKAKRQSGRFLLTAAHGTQLVTAQGISAPAAVRLDRNRTPSRAQIKRLLQKDLLARKWWPSLEHSFACLNREAAERVEAAIQSQKPLDHGSEKIDSATYVFVFIEEHRNV